METTYFNKNRAAWNQDEYNECQTKKSDCETSTLYCCNMYLTSFKHFKSKAATSKHYYCNMCSIGGYNG
jgi:Pyruvate/2-oxoacid:ferredoxin oxidoreductase delta subunit